MTTQQVETLEGTMSDNTASGDRHLEGPMSDNTANGDT